VRVAPILAIALVASGLAAPAASAGFGCSSSAGRVTVLGKSVEPVTVAAGAGGCTAESRSLTGTGIGLPAPLSADAAVAATEVYAAQKSVLATGGIANLAVATPSLPVDLSKVPDTLKSAIQSAVGTVSLVQVKAVARLPVDAPTNLKTDYPTDYLVGQVDLLSGVLVTLLNEADIEAANAAENARNAARNAANLALNRANAAKNAIIDAIPDTVALADSVLASVLASAKLPTVDLLRVRAAMAYAAGSCQAAAPSVNGSSTVAGVTVLGQEITLDRVVELTRTLTNTIDPSKASVTLSSLGLSSEQTALVAGAASAKLAEVNQALQSALSSMGNVDIPLGVADIRITPGAQVKSADSVTQQALGVTVTIAGQKLIDAVVGEATVSAADVDCAEPVTDPETRTGATLGCSARRLVLVDVLERGGRVKLLGVADPALAGRKVALVFDATGRRVATARVDQDGSFATTAPLPPAAIRDSNAARYRAVLGNEESINLKLRRRMVIGSMTSRNRRVTITGRVLPPLARPLKKITLTRRVSCTEEKVVTRFMPRRDGSFRVTVKAPRGLGTVVYRMTTKVRNSSTATALFETYTLPRAVDIDT